MEEATFEEIIVERLNKEDIYPQFENHTEFSEG